MQKEIIQVLSCSDVHGRHEQISAALDQFEKENCDYLVFHGDYCDSKERSNEDILRCVTKVIEAKKKYGDKVQLLIGNHELHYMFDDDFRCSGFRPEIKSTLKTLFDLNRDIFNVAFGIKNYLFTHAGVSDKWFLNNFETLDEIADLSGEDITNIQSLWKILNNVYKTSKNNILHQVSHYRGGIHDAGGITWADKREFTQLYKGIGDLHQIVGHTSIEDFTKHSWGEPDKSSITFIDVNWNYPDNYKFLKTSIENGEK